MRSAVAAAVVLILAACGGGEPADHSPGAPTAVLADFVLAARGGDAVRMRGLLSARFLDRYDATEEKLESSFIPAVRSEMGRFGATVEAGFEEQLTGDLAVAALRDASARPLPGPGAFAAPLVREADGWKVEPFGLDLIHGIPPTSVGSARPVITFGVNATGVPEGHVWVDGRELSVKQRPGFPITFEARPPRPLAAGKHLVVAFAKVGDRVGALAWVSTVE